MSQLSLKMAGILDDFCQTFDSEIPCYDLSEEQQAAIKQLARITHSALCQMSDVIVEIGDRK